MSTERHVLIKTNVFRNIHTVYSAIFLRNIWNQLRKVF